VKIILAAFIGMLALTWACAAAAGPNIGFADDATKYSDDGGARLFTEMNKLVTTSNRVAVFWDSGAPTTIQDQAFLDRMIPVAKKHHIQVVFAIYPKKATMAPVTSDMVEQFCSYAVKVMQRYTYVRKAIIGNEPNQPRFWQPIWNSDGSPASPAAMEAVLASCYDKLKAYDSSIDVIGVGLSPRGNDQPNASSNASISPVRWISALGKAYRASGRTAPLFDEFSWHCYPNINTDEVETGYAWPNTGCVNAARVKLALWDAFHGTGQPVTAGYPSTRTTSGLFGSLMTFIDETGWQVDTTSRDTRTPRTCPSSARRSRRRTTRSSSTLRTASRRSPTSTSSRSSTSPTEATCSRAVSSVSTSASGRRRSTRRTPSSTRSASTTARARAASGRRSATSSTRTPRSPRCTRRSRTRGRFRSRRRSSRAAASTSG
jgi:hypothetical protein